MYIRLEPHPSKPLDEIDVVFATNTLIKNTEFYESIINKETIQNGIKFITDIEVSIRESQRFKSDFENALDEFFNRYIEVLKIPISQNWRDDEINKMTLNKTIDTLQNNQSILKRTLLNERSDQKIGLIEIDMESSFA